MDWEVKLKSRSICRDFDLTKQTFSRVAMWGVLCGYRMSWIEQEGRLLCASISCSLASNGYDAHRLAMMEAWLLISMPQLSCCRRKLGATWWNYILRTETSGMMKVEGRFCSSKCSNLEVEGWSWQWHVEAIGFCSWNLEFVVKSVQFSQLRSCLEHINFSCYLWSFYNIHVKFRCSKWA